LSDLSANCVSDDGICSTDVDELLIFKEFLRKEVDSYQAQLDTADKRLATLTGDGTSLQSFRQGFKSLLGNKKKSSTVGRLGGGVQSSHRYGLGLPDGVGTEVGSKMEETVTQVVIDL